MIPLNVKELPAEEKLRIMEAIWDDMRDHYERTPIPPEILELLEERQSRVKRGDAKLLEWDQVKSLIGRG